MKIFLSILFIIIFVILFTWFISKFGNEKDNRVRNKVSTSDYKKECAGKMGEVLVSRELANCNLTNMIIKNDYYTWNNDKTTQIDHIVIAEEGVFCIETKNFEGLIYGQEEQRQWTQVCNYGHTKNQFYNPIKQNKTHTYVLNHMLPRGISINPIVVFVQDNAPEVEGVVNLKDLIQYLNQFQTKVLSLDKIDKIKKILDNNEITEEDIKQKHIENIQEMQEDIENNICPRCGGKLVLREGKYGKFYGCENYPKCKFKKSIQD